MTNRRDALRLLLVGFDLRLMLGDDLARDESVEKALARVKKMREDLKTEL